MNLIDENTGISFHSDFVKVLNNNEYDLNKDSRDLRCSV